MKKDLLGVQLGRYSNGTIYYWSGHTLHNDWTYRKYKTTNLNLCRNNRQD